MRKTKRQKRTSRFKFRESAIVLSTLFVFFTGAIGFAQKAAAISLKQKTIIENDVITLGDVFAGLDDKADKVLGPAPSPGKDMVLNARTLFRIARAMDLEWQPSSGLDQVVLSRAATVITPMVMKQHLKAALREKGVNGKFDLVFTSGQDSIILPPSEDARVEVINLHFSGTQNNFEAELVAPSKDKPLMRQRVSGSLQRIAEVPVLRSTLKNGNVISANDIDIIDVRADALQAGMVLSTDELIGMTPRRILVAGQPVKDAEIEAPQIVERGELVTMVFTNGPLSLTAQGRALESGAKGDVIRVVNASSSKNIQARVIGLKEVAVESF